MAGDFIPEEQLDLKGIHKYFNSYTLRGRFNSVVATYATLLGLIVTYKLFKLRPKFEPKIEPISRDSSPPKTEQTVKQTPAVKIEEPKVEPPAPKAEEPVAEVTPVKTEQTQTEQTKPEQMKSEPANLEQTKLEQEKKPEQKKPCKSTVETQTDHQPCHR